MVRALVRAKCVGMVRIEGETGAPILEREAAMGRREARAEAHVVAVFMSIVQS